MPSRSMLGRFMLRTILQKWQRPAAHTGAHALALGLAGLAVLVPPATGQPSAPDTAIRIDAVPESISVLTLSSAESLAVRHSPLLQAARWHVRAAEAGQGDAGRAVNPSLQSSIENVGGSIGASQAEYTLSASQTLELGGKRRARRETAAAEFAVAEAQREVGRLALIEEADERFLDSWESLRRLQLLRETENLARRTIAETTLRFHAGATPAVDSTRAEVELERVGVERSRAETEARGALRSLAATWGASDLVVDSLRLPPPDLGSIPELTTLDPALTAHPDRVLAAAELKAREVGVRATRAARVPDLEVSSGIRHFRESSATGLVGEISVGVPLWNKGRGQIRASEAEREAARSSADDVRIRLEARLRNAYERLSASLTLYGNYRDRLVPMSREALQQMESGYHSGRFSYLDLLEASRTHLLARIDLVQQERETWSAIREVERLTGRVFSTSGKGGER